MPLLDGPASSNALSQVDMQFSKCPIHLIPLLTLQKSKSLLQTTALHELQWVLLRLEALFAQVLDMDKFAALFVYQAGSLFLEAYLLLAEVMLGMMPRLFAPLLAHCLLLLHMLNSASRHSSLRTLTSQAHLIASTLPILPWSDLLFQLTAHLKAAHGSNSMVSYKHQQSCHATLTCTLSLPVKSSTAMTKDLQSLAQLPHRLVQVWFSVHSTMQTS
jgi:hypothetical protein